MTRCSFEAARVRPSRVTGLMAASGGGGCRWWIHRRRRRRHQLCEPTLSTYLSKPTTHFLFMEVTKSVWPSYYWHLRCIDMMWSISWASLWRRRRWGVVVDVGRGWKSHTSNERKRGRAEQMTGDAMAYYVHFYPCRIFLNGFAMGLLLSGSGETFWRDTSARDHDNWRLTPSRRWQSIIMVGLLDLTIKHYYHISHVSHSCASKF